MDWGWHLSLKHVDEQLASRLFASIVASLMDNSWDYNGGAMNSHGESTPMAIETKYS